MLKKVFIIVTSLILLLGVILVALLFIKRNIEIRSVKKEDNIDFPTEADISYIDFVQSIVEEYKNGALDSANVTDFGSIPYTIGKVVSIDVINKKIVLEVFYSPKDADTIGEVEIKPDFTSSNTSVLGFNPNKGLDPKGIYGCLSGDNTYSSASLEYDYQSIFSCLSTETFVAEFVGGDGERAPWDGKLQYLIYE